MRHGPSKYTFIKKTFHNATPNWEDITWSPQYNLHATRTNKRRALSLQEVEVDAWFLILHIVLETCTTSFKHKFNMSFICHFYTIGLMCWIWTNLQLKRWSLKALQNELIWGLQTWTLVVMGWSHQRLLTLTVNISGCYSLKSGGPTSSSQTDTSAISRLEPDGTVGVIRAWDSNLKLGPLSIADHQYVLGATWWDLIGDLGPTIPSGCSRWPHPCRSPPIGLRTTSQHKIRWRPILSCTNI